MDSKRKSPRAQRYDYTSPGIYFITICTKDRVHYFGEVKDGIVMMNDIGKWCEQEITQTKNIRKHICINEYVIMPNHIHLLITVGTRGNASYKITHDASINPDVLPYVPTESLGSIVRNIKSRVTKLCNENNQPFARQPRYYDHIIRNQNEHEKISQYIKDNPQNWSEDKFYQQ